MVCFMSFCAGTVSGKVWDSQRLNFICMCCSMWAGVVIQHEMSQSSVMQKLWSGLVPGVIRSVIHFISSHAQIVSNSFFPEIALDIFQTSVVCIKWLKWFTETGHAIIVTGQIHGCLCYYHTHTQHATLFVILGVGVGVKQNNSQYVWPVADFFSGICWSELVIYYKLPLNTNPVSVSSV